MDIRGSAEQPHLPVQLVASARDFVSAAFGVLSELQVIPTSRYHRFIRVGTDYEGGPLMGLSQFKELENLLQVAYPNRFSDPLKRRHPEFPNQYIFSLIEACVRRCADEGTYMADTVGVDTTINEFIALLEAPVHTVAVVCALSHVATHHGTAIVVDGVEVAPERSRHDYDFFIRECRERIPKAGAAFNREQPHIFGHPHAVISAVSTTEGSNGYDTARAVSRRLGRFMLVLRLLTGTTARAHFEMRGPTTLVGASEPHLVMYQTNHAMPQVRRTAVLRSDYERPMQELNALLDAVDLKRENMVAASFDVALGNFSSSFAADTIDTLVDLATALEAVLIDDKDGTDGITARLRLRAATLLATDGDPAANIFNDVGAFYGLRSTLVHGGNLSETRLRNKILGISTVKESHAFGIAAAQAVDRMRDIVRRAILARLCLATGADPLWPFNPKASIEAAFADDAKRVQLRTQWQSTLADIGAHWAARSLGAPEDILRVDYGSDGS